MFLLHCEQFYSYKSPYFPYICSIENKISNAIIN